MGEKTSISWTEATHNFWWGCEAVSPGCDNCYAQHISETLWKQPFNILRRNDKNFDAPLKWLQPRRIFTCSMSDFFHADADKWRQAAWEVIRATGHTWQILTKRSSRIKRCLPPDWGEGYSNVWLGVSVENPDYYFRIKDLQAIPAAVRFLSLEPLLAPLPELPLEGIHWAIVGGESGAKYRPMFNEWAADILAQCRSNGVAFFGKQRAHRQNEMPLQIGGALIKEFPGAPSEAR